MKNTKVTCPTCKGKRPTINRCITCDSTGQISKSYARHMKYCNEVPEIGRFAVSESENIQQHKLWRNINNP